MKRIARCTLAAALLLTAGCDKNTLVSNRYSSLPARFAFSPTISVPVLHNSINSPGEWCSIRLQGQKLIFTNPSVAQPGTWNLTALQGYTGFYLGVGNGLAVGLPNMPEIGADMPVVTCYDLCCSNCWEQYTITKPLTLHEGGEAQCTRCNRHYDLNNQGLIARGEAGKSLYRYRVFYNGNAINVSNP